MTETPVKVIIDTDPGIDDAQAIAYAVAEPHLDLLGLTTVFGNVSVELATRNALILTELLGAEDVVVAAGADKPLVGDRLPAPDFVHGSDGLGNLNLADPACHPDARSAAGFIIDMANQYPGEVVVIAVGPLTNIAAALSEDPGLPDKLRELIVMGGTVDEPGNVSPVTEANFLNDPHAADAVLSANWPATLIGLDVTHQILLHDEHLDGLRRHAGAVGQFLWDSSRFYVDFYSQRALQAGNAGRYCAMHDATAVVYLLERTAFKCAAGPARVVPDGIAVGQLIIDRKGNADESGHWQGRPHVSAAMTVDASRVRDAFLATVTEHFGT